MEETRLPKKMLQYQPKRKNREETWERCINDERSLCETGRDSSLMSEVQIMMLCIIVWSEKNYFWNFEKGL